MKQNLHNMREEYRSEILRIEDLAAQPMQQFQQWFQFAIDRNVPEPNAFVLATVDSNLQPHARVVLVKEIRKTSLVFYTNYDSKKGRHMAKNNAVAACFFWQPLHQQVRMTGRVHQLDSKESDSYFQSRPLESRIGAIVSPQSKEIKSREWLEEKWQQKKKEVGEKPERPNNWGGYELKVTTVEFWQGQPGRLHDRFLYEQKDREWVVKRLAP